MTSLFECARGRLAPGKEVRGNYHRAPMRTSADPRKFLDVVLNFRQAGESPTVARGVYRWH
jgi:hypothetical protein